MDWSSGRGSEVHIRNLSAIRALCVTCRFVKVRGVCRYYPVTACGRFVSDGLTPSIVSSSVTIPTVCDFCKQPGSLVVERNTETNRLLVGCLNCGYWWSTPSAAPLERRSMPDRRKASRTDRRER
jgi:hypothetical protein